jgi:hypothetical protein
MDRDMPERFEAVVDRAFDPLRLVALFNFDDEAKDLEYVLPGGRVDLALVEPHGCRVLSLRPADDAPGLVGSTAHIGSGWLDITSVGRSSDTLTIEVAPVGRRVRRLVVATAGRRVQSVTAGGADTPFESRRDACVIPLLVNDPFVVEVRFGDAADG